MRGMMYVMRKVTAAGESPAKSPWLFQGRNGPAGDSPAAQHAPRQLGASFLPVPCAATPVQRNGQNMHQSVNFRGAVVPADATRSAGVSAGARGPFTGNGE